MNSFEQRLSQPRPLLLDGALGTELFARGLDMGTAPELVNLKSPHLLRDIARDYAAAGAEVVTTSTFGASPLKLKRTGLAPKMREICSRAVEAVREGAPEAWVAGNLGPCGELLQPYGEVDPVQLRASFEQQCAVLSELGVDLFLIETMIDLGEARLAIEAARAIRTDIPIAVTLTFEHSPRGFYTVMGTGVEQACQELAGAGATLIGANCGQGSHTMATLAQELCAHSPLPVLVQSNAGLPEIVDGEARYNEDVDTWVTAVRSMLDAGVRAVGGCCGTTPAYIAAVRELLDSRVT